MDGSSIARHSAEHLALHPFGKVPVLLHGERQVFETTSICRYLDAAFPQSSLQPHDLAQRTEVDQWSAALALYVDDRLIRRYLLLIASPIPPARPVDPEALATAAPAAIQTLDLLARQLGDRAFFCGTRYSMADALLTPHAGLSAAIARRGGLAGTAAEPARLPATHAPAPVGSDGAGTA
ncbi:glutathione S-transferase family protein [Azotobacter vinelandii]